MACNTCNGIRQKDFEYMRNLAEKQAILNETDIQIYKYNKAGFGEVYAYEPTQKGRFGIVEIIDFRDAKSKAVLRSAKKSKPKSAKPKKKESSGEVLTESVVQDS